MTRIFSYIVLLLLLSQPAAAQRKHQKKDTLAAYREIAQLGQWYRQLPVHINLHFSNKAAAVRTSDSTETDMTLYYGEHAFYLQAEGMEQIANDSMMVLVNHEANMIRIYRDEGQLKSRLEKAASLFMPDSSLKNLAGRYTATVEDERSGLKRITLQSRENISGTFLPKEKVSITYRADNHEPVACMQQRRNLVLVDSLAYERLAKETAYTGRLVSAQTRRGNLFFVVREQITDCRFTAIRHDHPSPPVLEQDRVIRGSDGNYQPAKGYEEYRLTKEF